MGFQPPAGGEKARLAAGDPSSPREPRGHAPRRPGWLQWSSRRAAIGGGEGGAGQVRLEGLLGGVGAGGGWSLQCGLALASRALGRLLPSLRSLEFGGTFAGGEMRIFF